MGNRGIPAACLIPTGEIVYRMLSWTSDNVNESSASLHAILHLNDFNA
jgi:hypothetical protein